MKVDFYTQIHKALRRWLFLFSIKVATTDFNNQIVIQSLCDEQAKLFALLKVHAEHEEGFFHPLILKKLNNYQRKLHEEHEQQEGNLVELENLMHDILHQTNLNKKIELGRVLYLKTNLFIANYLQHLAEEESIMPLLQQRCSETELLTALNNLFANLNQQAIIDSISYMMPALNLSERINLMHGLLTNSSSDMQLKVIKTAEHALTGDEWAMLRQQLN